VRVTTVRPAASNDFLALKEIIDLSFPRFYRYFASHSVHDEDGQTLVAQEENQIVAFARLIDFTISGAKYSCILWIAVHPTQRRRGIALALTNASIQQLKKQGAKAVFASTNRRNHAALTTLARAGFAALGFLGLRRLFGWYVFEFYRDIWFAPYEVVLMHS
jgi:ribosomal protein S18 acetylase RimI-like enzyme